MSFDVVFEEEILWDVVCWWLVYCEWEWYGDEVVVFDFVGGEFWGDGFFYVFVVDGYLVSKIVFLFGVVKFF